MKTMSGASQQKLLELNRAFYATVAQAFDHTRGGPAVGWAQLAPYLPSPEPGARLRVLDAGCGNGRFARFLEQEAIDCDYLGIDGADALLARAATNTTGLASVRCRFVQADLSYPAWAAQLGLPAHSFDLIVCLAVLHHLPGLALRQKLLAELASLLAPDGVLILSNWQFLTSARFTEKLIDWERAGLCAADVEPGDALLPWRQGVEAVRYVHQIDEAEVNRLATLTGLAVRGHYYADGKEGNLNLYTILTRPGQN